MMSSTLQRVQRYWRQHPWVGTVLLFLVAAALFAWWVWVPSFRDPDAFYHLRLGELLMKQRVAVTDFVWLPFTTLAGAYADHHFLYHLFLVPFIFLFDSFVGMKVATVVLAAGTIGLFYAVLRSMGVRYATIYALLLLTNADFAFRMSLSKAPSVAFLFVILGFWLIATNRWRLLSLVSFLFVWSYGGFIILPGIAVVYGMVQLVRHIAKAVPTRKELLTYFTPASAAIGGTVAGLLIHPSFPHNLQFYWQQVVQIAVVNYQSVIGVGGEWYPRAFEDLVVGGMFPTAVMVLGLILALRNVKHIHAREWTGVIVAATLFLLTLKSQRYIEYYVPWALLTGALLISRGTTQAQWAKAQQRVIGWWNVGAVHKAAITLGVVAPVVLAGALTLNTVLNNRASAHDIPFTRFAAATSWLRDHSTKGDIVLHSDWDEFPLLFYGVTRDRFIAGLDPTFLYNANQELYWKWVHITTGKQRDNLLEIIQNDFNARFVFIENGHDAMQRNIILDGGFKEVYRDREAAIYRVPRKKASTSPQE